MFTMKGSVLISTGKNGVELRAHYDDASDTITLCRWRGGTISEFVQCFGRDEIDKLHDMMDRT